MMLSLGIVGNGFVGKAAQGFASRSTRLVVFDKDPSLCVPLGTTWSDVAACDLVMVAVPTPMRKDGECSVAIVDSVVQSLRDHGNPIIIIRSTVPVGYSASRNVFFMPEFLTEKNWAHDFRVQPEWILGVDDQESRDRIQEKVQQLLTQAKEDGNILSDQLLFFSTKEAEAIKYFRNCFLSTKVAFCNEFYDFCSSHGLNYKQVIGIAAADPRITPSHTSVPGPDGRRGFGGTCFPKDLASLVYQFQQKQIPSPLLQAVQDRNVTVDRPSQDWKDDVGRAVEDSSSS